MTEPQWLQLARTFLGTTEIPGPKHNSKILQWWADIRSTIRDDETPYCAAFVGSMLERSGIDSTRSPAARSYLKWGSQLATPVPGCIVVYARPGCSWCGHVGFVVGEDRKGNIMTLGANQGNTVSIAPFSRDRVLNYRWPATRLFQSVALPILDSNSQLSTQEA